MEKKQKPNIKNVDNNTGNDIDKWKEQLKTAENNFEIYYKNYQSKKNEVIEISKKLNDLNKSYEKLKKDMDDVCVKNIYLENINKKLEEENKKMKTELKNTHSKFDGAINQFEKLGQQIKDKDKRLEEMSKIQEENKELKEINEKFSKAIKTGETKEEYLVKPAEEYYDVVVDIDSINSLKNDGWQIKYNKERKDIYEKIIS